jgi:hypothetical protein
MEIAGVFLMFGFGGSALLVLTLAAVRARSIAIVVLAGIAGLLLLAMQCAVWWWGGAIGSATGASSEGAFDFFHIGVPASILIIMFYIPIAILRVRSLPDRSSHDPTA